MAGTLSNLSRLSIQDGIAEDSIMGDLDSRISGKAGDKIGF
ncbi:hypothetical protein CCACVL1_17848 [Corchorus capsularis]|uniref:Uncharacterized protein n=1 Tax=Corchorus capsularis TaxID=210143 RepID=A0A1R3HPZ7_COCAP|nr:hypothetical protein CCACVL1_17848 [Corchorus capsularis]